jgi:hypothetical protein
MGGSFPTATTTQNHGTRTPLVVLTQRAIGCLGLLTPHARLETSLRIAHTTNPPVPTGWYSRPLAGVIARQQSRIALSGLSPVSFGPRRGGEGIEANFRLLDLARLNELCLASCFD